MSRRLAIMPVSGELLRQVLRLPELVRVEQVAYDINQDHFLLRLEGPDFPEVRESDVVIRTQAMYRSEGIGHVEFVGWSHLQNAEDPK